MSKTDEYSRIAREFWMVFKKHFGIRQDDDSWKDCVNDFDSVMAKYANTGQAMFARRLYTTFMREIEAESKRERS